MPVELPAPAARLFSAAEYTTRAWYAYTLTTLVVLAVLGAAAVRAVLVHVFVRAE